MKILNIIQLIYDITLTGTFAPLTTLSVVFPSKNLSKPCLPDLPIIT